MNPIDADKLHVVLGATGGAGSAIVRELLRQGKPVRAVSSRTPKITVDGLEWAQANLSDPEQVAAATEGASVVYHAAQPAYTRWVEEFPAMNRAITNGVSRVGARLVVVDNLYMYGPTDGPLNETTPEAALGKKGRLRARLGQEWLETYRSGVLPVAILRAADYYGPNIHNSVVGLEFFTAIRDGQPATWFVDANQPRSLTFVDDLARALILTAGQESAFGQIWHVPTADPITATAFAHLIAEEAHAVAQPLIVVPGAVVASSSEDMMIELAELLYQVERPFITDGSRFSTTFGFQPTPHRDAVRRTLEWTKVNDLANAPA